MTIEEKLKDLIAQATTERSHYYVRSVCEDSLKEIELLKVMASVEMARKQAAKIHRLEAALNKILGGAYDHAPDYVNFDDWVRKDIQDILEPKNGQKEKGEA